MTGSDHIAAGRTALGIELGSTRIKAVLIGPDHRPLATGSHEWENRFVDRVWTYSLDAVRAGLQACYAALTDEVRDRHGVELTTVGALGVSAMMHGYLAFDADDELLVPFRTWRNTTTGEAAEELSALFGQNIPQRWSIAHLRQAIRDGEPHVPALAHLTTLAGHVHWQLTGERVLGIGDASGVFPVDSATGSYDARLVERFDELVSGDGLPWRLTDLLPSVRRSGEVAGHLTEAGARLLDPSGRLRAGTPLCPPEGDAGTGMVATNSVAPGTANVSAGTSIFAMVVLDRPLAGQHPELDLVTTPAGDPVAMVHCNNGASELNAWAGLFAEFAAAIGAPAEPSTVFEALLQASLEAEPDAGGLVAYNYLAGESITNLAEGRPLLVRTPDSRLTLANLVRAQLFGALATLRMGMGILLQDEGVRVDNVFAHGGLFRTQGVAQRYLAAALDVPVSVGDIAANGGPWGMALLAASMAEAGDRPLAEYLAEDVFGDVTLETLDPEPEDVAGFADYLRRFEAGLAVERAAVASL